MVKDGLEGKKANPPGMECFKLYRNCINKGKFPKEWKHSEITLYKEKIKLMSHSSGQEDCLQMFPKFMIYYSQQVLTFILAKFLPFSIRILRKKSAVLQLIIQDSIYKNIDQKEIEQIVALNADFSKAVSGSPTVD